jgi:hypothetical protein
VKRGAKILASAAVASMAVLAMAGCASKGSTAAGSGGTSGGGSGGGQPPSFSATAPDEYRILPAPGFRAPCPQGDCAVPDVPSVVVKDATGAKVGLLIDPDARQDNPQRMQVRVCPFATTGIDRRAQMNKCVIHLVAGGDSFTELGLKVTVARLWWMTDDKNDALDATIATV